MKIRRHVLLSALFGIGVLGLAVAGCQNKRPNSGTKASHPGPKESFAGIVQFARRQIETGAGGMPPGFVITGEGGRRSQFVVRNDVTSEFIPPAKEGEPYRGTITITSSSTYSLRRTEEGDQSGERSESNSDQNVERRSLLDQSDSNGTGIDILDNDLVSSTPHPAEEGNAAAGEPSTVVQRRPDESVRTFEFAYENDRWVLKTEPDAETERAIKRAFDRALQLQP